jgi:hypothetical protein
LRRTRYTVIIPSNAATVFTKSGFASEKVPSHETPFPFKKFHPDRFQNRPTTLLPSASQRIDINIKARATSTSKHSSLSAVKNAKT